MVRSRGRRIWTPLRIGMAVLAVVVVTFAVVLALQPSQGAVEARTPLLEHSAPSISGPHLSGPPLGTWRKGWTVVNFFASWCSDCSLEASQLRRFNQQMAPSGVRTVMVSYDDTASAAKSFLKQTGASWTAMSDPSGSTALAWGVTGPPETFVISPGGLVVAKFVGPINAGQLVDVIFSGRAKT